MNFISNNLLSYIQLCNIYYICENVRTVTQRFYSPEEISEARSFLWKAADEKITDEILLIGQAQIELGTTRKGH